MPSWLTLTVFLVALLSGVGSIGSACWVWVRKQAFHVGGASLTAAGVVLIGLSVWSEVRIKLPGGTQFDLSKIVSEAVARDPLRAQIQLLEALEQNPALMAKIVPEVIARAPSNYSEPVLSQSIARVASERGDAGPGDDVDEEALLESLRNWSNSDARSFEARIDRELVELGVQPTDG